jgi:glycerol-1-phosphate dehydrogenase [NAD(P)+]
MAFPVPFHIQFGIGVGKIAEQIDDFVSLLSARVLIITGTTVSLKYADAIKKQLSVSASTVQIRAGSIEEIYVLERMIRQSTYTHLLSIGGGRVGDFAKRLALLSNLRLLMIPTIIANDGLISPVAVLRDEEHSVSVAGRMPDAVFLDLDVLKRAPAQYLIAAACDLASNISATNDWARFSPSDVRAKSLAYYLSQAAADGVIWSGDWSVASNTFLERVILGQTLSGFSMALAGSSRPCSGAEHLICHAIDQLGLAPSVLHGCVVASTTRFTLALQGAFDLRMRDFLAHFEVPLKFPGCEELQGNELERLFAVARRTRPGRQTVLEEYSDRELVQEYERFCTDGYPVTDGKGGSTIRQLTNEIGQALDHFYPEAEVVVTQPILVNA